MQYTKLSSLLSFLDESKADKVKSALLAKYPDDQEAVSKVLAANMLGPSLWFPAMEMWSARKTEPIEETIAAITSYVKNREKLGDISQYKTTDQLRAALNVLVSKSAMKNMAKAAKSSADRIYEDSDYVVVFAKSKEASCVYGAGTTWCTAATEKGNLFYPYARNGVWLYYIIDKKDDPRENPFAKMSIGFDGAGKISWGRDGGLSVNAVNDGLREKTVREVLGDRFEPIFAAINKHHQTNSGPVAAADPSQGFVTRQHPALENYRKLVNDPAALLAELEKFAAADDSDAIVDYIRGLGDIAGYNPDSLIIFFDVLNGMDQLEDSYDGRTYYPHKFYQLFAKFFTKNPQAKQDKRIWDHLLHKLEGNDVGFIPSMILTYCESLRPEELAAIVQIIGDLTVELYGQTLTPYIEHEYINQNPDIFSQRFDNLAKRLVSKRDDGYILALVRTINSDVRMNAQNRFLFMVAFLEALYPDPDNEGTEKHSRDTVRTVADLCMDYILGNEVTDLPDHPYRIFNAASPEKKFPLIQSDPRKNWWLISNGGYVLRDLFRSFAGDPNNPPEIQNAVAEAVMQPYLSKLSNISFYQKDLVRLMLRNFKALTPENKQALADYHHPNRLDESLGLQQLLYRSIG